MQSKKNRRLGRREGRPFVRVKKCKTVAFDRCSREKEGAPDDALVSGFTAARALHALVVFRCAYRISRIYSWSKSFAPQHRFLIIRFE